MNFKKIVAILSVGAIALGLSACGDTVSSGTGDVAIEFDGTDAYGDQLFSYVVELDADIASVDAELTDADGQLVDGYFYIGENAAGVDGANALKNDGTVSQDIDVNKLVDSTGTALDATNFVGAGSFHGITCDGKYTFKITLTDVNGNTESGTNVLTVDNLGACANTQSSSSGNSSSGELDPSALLIESAEYTLGGDNNSTYGSYIDLDAGKVYKMIERTDANAAIIDFQYAVDAGGTAPAGPVFVTPDVAASDTDLKWVATISVDAINKLSVIYPSTMTAADFDAAKNVGDFLNTYNAADASGFINVAVGDVIIVETEEYDPAADNFVGIYMLKITAQSDNTKAGSISFVTKTEEK